LVPPNYLMWKLHSKKIIKVVKKLEEAGTITIAGAGGGDLV